MKDAIFLGQRHGYADSKTDYFLPIDHLSRHCYVLGKTGMGKTTFLQTLLFSLIRQDRGVGVIDPHGDFAASLLAAVPRERIDDVVFIDATDKEFAPALNLVSSTINAKARPRVASALVAAFRHIWSDSWGPRLEYILYHALRALLDHENSSLIALPRLLTDQTFRRRVLRRCQDPFVRSFWNDEFDQWDKRFRQEAISPVLNKLGQFVSNPVLRNMFGQVRLKVDFREVLDSKRILIVNISKGEIGEDASRLAGSLLTAFIASHAMERSELAQHERTSFTLVLDEAQNFLSDALASILSESRKYGLSLVLSHQFLEQLSPSLQSAVLGNAGTLVALRVAADDAARLATNFGNNYPPHQFVELEPFHAFVRPVEESPFPFRLAIAPPEKIDGSYRQSIVTKCRDRFATSQARINDRFQRWAAQGSGHLPLE